MPNKQRIDPETELNIFARFFGSLLVGLKHHDLRLKNQNRIQPDYIPESSVEFVKHIR